MPAPRPKSRLVSFLLIGTIGLLLSGCVYLRLLELKKQLNHFDENFTLSTSEDLLLHCLHPVLQPDDLRWLGASPKTRTPRDNGEEWLVRWIKETTPDAKEELVYDMTFYAYFVDNRMVDIRIPKRYLAYVSKDLVLNILRATGSARVDKEEHKADAQTEATAATPMPNLAAIKTMLGEPTSRQVSSNQITQLYRYRLDSATVAKPIEASFSFDSVTGELRRFTVHLPRGTLNYEFKPVPPR